MCFAEPDPNSNVICICSDDKKYTGLHGDSIEYRTPDFFVKSGVFVNESELLRGWLRITSTGRACCGKHGVLRLLSGSRTDFRRFWKVIWDMYRNSGRKEMSHKQATEKSAESIGGFFTFHPEFLPQIHPDPPGHPASECRISDRRGRS